MNPKLKYLEDVPWDNSLKLSNGKTVHGLEQLPMVLKFSDEEVFNSHVTLDKNDFANWVRDVIGYPELADQMLKFKTKDDFLKFMEQAIIDIKNYTSPEPIPEPVKTPESLTVAESPKISEPIKVAEPVKAPESAPQTLSPPVQQATQPIVPIQPAVQPIIEPVVQSASPTVQPVEAQVPVQTIIQPLQNSPVPEVVPTVPVSTLVSAPTPETTNDVIEEIFDFEEIFKVLITELDQEVLAWDTQTS